MPCYYNVTNVVDVSDLGRRCDKLQAAVHVEWQGRVPHRAVVEVQDSRAVAQRQGVHLEGQCVD
jgi:hypothetical protein